VRWVWVVVVENDMRRILPTSWHGGVFGKAGATFYSVQKYINGTLPSSAGEEWYGADGSTQYKV